MIDGLGLASTYESGSAWNKEKKLKKCQQGFVKFDTAAIGSYLYITGK